MTDLDMLRAPEAAVVAGLALRDMNRAVDEHILPEGFVVVDEGRYFTPGACVAMAFYSDSAENLTSAARVSVIRAFAQKLRNFRAHDAHGTGRENWSLQRDYLTVDLAPFVERVVDGLGRLRLAHEAVTSSPRVLRGTPVLRGTRVPVHDVAASVAAGNDRTAIREAYPTLSDAAIDHAVVYAAANPPRGRPRTRIAPAADAAVVVRRVKRNKTGG